jgi:plastocyanin
MRKNLLLIPLLALAGMARAQATHELTNVGDSFSPATITLVAGDSIHLVLADPHTCTEVSEATWNVNGSTSNGGFDFPPGEHTFVLDVPGTYYYVCVPHADMGMKGKFIVENGSGVRDRPAATAMELRPNPAEGSVQVLGLAAGQRVQVRNMAGAVVLEAEPGMDGLLDISALSTGSYGVQVRDGHGVLIGSHRLLVAH